MTDDKVLSQLRELHEELAEINNQLKSTDDVNAETIDALGDLLSDVGNLFDQAKSIQEKEHEAKHQDLSDRIVKLETDHPMVTSFLSRITDVLAMMGI